MAIIEKNLAALFFVQSIQAVQEFTPTGAHQAIDAEDLAFVNFQVDISNFARRS